MELKDIAKNMDNLKKEEEFKETLNKMTAAIIEVIKKDPEKYKDKEYVKELLETSDKHR